MSSYTNFKVDLNNKNSSWTIIYNEIKDRSKVLDIGCSSGYFDEIIKNDKNCIVDGIEYNEKDAKIASDICRKVVIGDIESDEFPWDKITDKYDYILFIDVLEHLVNPSRCLGHVSKYLNKGGKIIFSIPNMANGSVRLQLLQGNFDYEKDGLLDSTHLHYYTFDTIKKMVKSSGLNFHKLDFTTFDTPREIIKKIISKIGLETTDEFCDYINNGDSLVYQYIVVLGVEASDYKIQNVNNSAIKPKLSYEKQINDIQNDARKIFLNNSKLNEIIFRKDKDILEFKKVLQNKDKDILEFKKVLQHRDNDILTLNELIKSTNSIIS